MPDIYDPERGLKIGLTDEDYENYQNGNLSDDFYARRTDGSIANRVTISPLDDDNDEDGEPSGGIDPGSAVIGALIMATIAGATYGIKKLWDRHKAKKAETQVNVRKEEGTQLSTETACEVLSTETAKSNDAEPKSLTQEEAIQELMKILVGMAEIAAGKKKVSEGVENLSNAGIVDRMVLLKKLSDSQTLEWTREKMEEFDKQGRLIFPDSPNGRIQYKQYLDEMKGTKLQDIWLDVYPVNPVAKERNGYPTQKSEALLERIIKMCAPKNGLVFDCFMGSGTTQAAAMKLGRRFIGADINLGAIQTTTKRLLSVAKELEDGQTCMESSGEIKYTGFEVYNVNNYDFFRNPVEARDLLISALEIQPFPQSDVWDGELDGRMVKIMPVNRIATKADLKELLANLPYKTYEKRKEENPNQPVERVTIVCMGHESDLKGVLEQELIEYKVDVQIVDILRDKKDLQLKRDSEAEIVREGDKLVIRSFYPMNLLQKLSLQKEYVEDWRQLVDSIMIDWNYDGVVMQPVVTDIPDKSEMVSGIYDIPENAGTIKVKITDLLSESLEVEVR